MVVLGLVASKMYLGGRMNAPWHARFDRRSALAVFIFDNLSGAVGLRKIIVLENKVGLGGIVVLNA